MLEARLQAGSPGGPLSPGGPRASAGKACLTSDPSRVDVCPVGGQGSH